MKIDPQKGFGISDRFPSTHFSEAMVDEGIKGVFSPHSPLVGPPKKLGSGAKVQQQIEAMWIHWFHKLLMVQKSQTTTVWMYKTL